MFTYHYVNSKKGWNLEWKNMDNVNQCSYKNLTANYLTKPIITDLDNDKKAEIWFVYVLGCRQYHLTPLGIREVVYVNGERATVRGLQITKNGDKTYGGVYLLVNLRVGLCLCVIVRERLMFGEITRIVSQL